MRRNDTAILAFMVVAASIAACNGSKNNGPPPGGSGGSGGAAGGAGGTAGGGGVGGVPLPPFEPLSPAVYATRVKNLLTGLPLSDAELTAVTAEASALRVLIDTWIALPQWRSKMTEFFRQSFQQTQTDITDYDDQLGVTTNPWNPFDQVRFLKAVEQSFALTAMQLVDDGRPFTETVTTERFMLNPPLMAAYAWLDNHARNDENRPVPQQMWLLGKYPNLTVERTTNPDGVTGLPTPIPIEETIDPQSSNFMRWYEPRPYNGQDPTCAEPETRQGVGAFAYVFTYLFGGRIGCGSTDSQWTETDWNAWRMVTVRPPVIDEERTTFWDVPRMRDPATTQLVLATPRVGFFTTPAFMANWATNDSNLYRVTVNQTLIVALGRSFDDSDTTVTVNETSVDTAHIQPGTTCYGCHITLDPMTEFFRQSYSIPYSLQADPDALAAEGTFSVDGSAPMTGLGVRVFAQGLAQHPGFAAAWTQKLCQYANSASCSPSDPEFLRVAALFRDSSFNFKTLTRELFSSPLVTFAARTQTSDDNGMIISIARREALCAALDHRLGLADACALRVEVTGDRRSQVPTERNLALSVPGAGYARGDAKPLLPHDPSLFFHSASENLCALLATRLIDAGTTPRYASARKDEAVADFVANVMGLPVGDPRAAPMRQILDEHHAEAVTAGASATEALRSTFTLACASPLGISSGL